MAQKADWREWKFDCRICNSSDTDREGGSGRVYCQKCEFLDLVEAAEEES